MQSDLQVLHKDQLCLEGVNHVNREWTFPLRFYNAHLYIGDGEAGFPLLVMQRPHFNIIFYPSAVFCGHFQMYTFNIIHTRHTAQLAISRLSRKLYVYIDSPQRNLEKFQVPLLLLLQTIQFLIYFFYH